MKSEKEMFCLSRTEGYPMWFISSSPQLFSKFNFLTKFIQASDKNHVVFTKFTPVYQQNKLSMRYIKGTKARDFWPLVLFRDRPHIDRGENT
jgi:hypothetical protein